MWQCVSQKSLARIARIEWIHQSIPMFENSSSRSIQLNWNFNVTYYVILQKPSSFWRIIKQNFDNGKNSTPRKRVVAKTLNWLWNHKRWPWWTEMDRTSPTSTKKKILLYCHPEKLQCQFYPFKTGEVISTTFMKKRHFYPTCNSLLVFC